MLGLAVPAGGQENKSVFPKLVLDQHSRRVYVKALRNLAECQTQRYLQQASPLVLGAFQAFQVSGEHQGEEIPSRAVPGASNLVLLQAFQQLRNFFKSGFLLISDALSLVH